MKQIPEDEVKANNLVLITENIPFPANGTVYEMSIFSGKAIRFLLCYQSLNQTNIFEEKNCLMVVGRKENAYVTFHISASMLKIPEVLHKYVLNEVFREFLQLEIKEYAKEIN